jgi:hypothetical protein
MWPEDFVWRGPVPPPGRWGRPGLVMLFNLECAACVSRGVPLIKRVAAERGDALQLVMVHTAYGHRQHPREALVPALERFAGAFARLEVPVALDLDGSLAAAWGAEGTPHWLIYDAVGRRLRSVYGSQENAQTRLAYALDELLAGGEGDAPAS